MTKKKPPLSIDDLWALDRIGSLALSPDGTQAVCTVTRGSLEDNTSTTALWTMPTRGRGAPRRLTWCGDKDGQPAWSPDGDHIAFVAKRTQQGETDKTPQLYVIPARGGEAERVSAFAPGIESFKWLPGGRRIVFAAWLWPALRGAAAQNRRHRVETERKETGIATSEAHYRHWDHDFPTGRELHLLLLDLRSGRVTDLFEGRGLELPREAGGAGVYDPSPDGRRIAFAHDPVRPPVPGRPWAISEIDLRTRRVRRLAADPGWDCGAPRYRPDGGALAMTAAPVGERHTAFSRLALVEPGRRWRVVSDPARDLDVEGPLHWADDGRTLLFAAEQRGRRHLWRCAVDDGAVHAVIEGGWVQSFDVAAATIAFAGDSARHPVRVFASQAGAAPRRLESFNDALLARRTLGEQREVTITGALGEPVQMWLTFPAGFDPKRKHPLLQVIHGGPYAASGDSFNYRWNPHLLASRGHVVAQVNYHGSSGFGFAFRDSIMGRQGELELQDIEAASDWLLAQPWANPQRLHAAGGSYGGFLVAWMNGHVPAGRYRRYVCHAGVFDRIATFAADSYMQRPRDLHARYWEGREAMDRVLAQSPHAAAARMDTPTLVTHGANDYRVPDCNGLAYYNTLKARGVEARLLWFPDENHWVLKPCNSRLWYREVLDWVGGSGRPRAKRG